MGHFKALGYKIGDITPLYGMENKKSSDSLGYLDIKSFSSIAAHRLPAVNEIATLYVLSLNFLWGGQDRVAIKASAS